MKMKISYNISRKCRPLMLAIAMWAGLVMEGWGQTLPRIIDVGDDLVRHTTTETLYVIAGQEGTLELQESGNIQDNIDGYIRWYTLENGQAGKNGLSRAGTTTAQTVLTEYENGYAWTSVARVMPTKEVNTIIYNFTQEQIDAGISIVCDASSVWGTTATSGDLSPRVVSIRHIYVVKDAAAAGSRNYVMEEKKSRFSELNIEDGRSDITPLLKAYNPEDYVLYKYEIHTPIPERTLLESGGYYTDYSNFRLSDRVTNYFVKNNSGDIVAATGVRWTFYGSDGKKLSGDFQIITNESRVNLSLYEDGLSPSKKHTRYVLAEVASGSGSGNSFKATSAWYPVSLLTVTLEPYTKAMTAEKLKEKENDPNYADRLTALKLNPTRYKQVASISFEEEGDTLLNPEEYLKSNKASNFKNFSIGPFTEGSHYAFAEPQLAPYKENKRITATRGEYVLYRTLGYPGISSNSDAVTIGNTSCKYIDYFMVNNSRYQVKVTDRLWEKTNGAQSGYFMFLDATDEAGVITKISISDRLCENTSLLVSAWICDLSFDVRNSKVVQSDVALTFKKRNKITKEETILSKFYTGELIRQPEYGDAYATFAQWQQVSFKFSINEPLSDEEEYLVEIANNSKGSSGADYAIDDIQVFRTLPNIQVQREDACDMSTLTISSNYETLLRNMGYMENEQTINDWSTIDENLLMYRLGLNGAPNYGDGSANFLTKDAFESYMFNSYYSFVEGLDDSRPNTEAVSITKIDDESLKLENPDPIILGPTDLETGEYSDKDVYRWVRINKNLKEYNPREVFSYRTIITTRAPGYDTGGTHYNYVSTAEEAQKWEYVFNLRALQDYNFLVNNWDRVASNFTAIPVKPSWLEGASEVAVPEVLKNSDYLNFDDVNLTHIGDLAPMTEEEQQAYEEVMHEFWSKIDIPRIRVPWYDSTQDVMYLHRMEVGNTDLKYEGEVVGTDDNGNSITASGNYHVVLQNVQAISSGTVNVKDVCLLISPFKIYTPVKISMDAAASTNVYACVGTLRKVSANLVSKDDEDPLDGAVYSFDWYLGSIASYDLLEVEGYYLQDMLDRLRTDYGSVFGADFGYSEVNAWQPTEDIDKEIKDILLGLLNPENPMLILNKKEFQLRLTTPLIVAMPFVTDVLPDTSGIETEYCLEITEVSIPAYSTDVPLLHPGFTPTNITYPFAGEVALRLGYPTMDDAIQLVVPLQDGFGASMDDEAQYLGLADPENGASIVLNSIQDDYPVIGTAVKMFMQKDDTNATVTIKFDRDKVKSLLREGRRYDLLIPFVQLDSDNKQMTWVCDGLLSLPVKIVPEYLTWEGSAGDKWYDEDKWNQSTKRDLYFDGWDGTEADQDANGSDNVDEAYSPLYFTRITIPDGGELALNTVETDANDSRFMAGWATDSSDSIRFEMAVDKASDGNLEVVPYYIHKVDQIYFKPETKLKSQYLLDYQKAWVEFEMEKGKRYWLASPLKDVFAGDMYAPTLTGRQTTPAFADITYTDKTAGGNYDRWNPAFYQKAWDKGVTCYTNAAGTVSESVSAVQSNWSIEYNDVNVPYTLGKGFYASVEGDFTGDGNNGVALVRLPKSDNSYSYYTRSADVSSIAERAYAGKLADGSDINITLSDNDAVAVNSNPDGDGTHFLLGNPYMYPLDMTKFFDGNGAIFNRKYWILSDGTTSAAVGTPDTGFGDDTGATVTPGQIPPMTAFFVELATPLSEPEKSVEIKFTKDMIADAVSPSSIKTRSYSASCPVITLTADRGDVRSVARLIISDKADNGYVASEDAVVLLDSELDAPMAYTVAGSTAAQVNALKSVKNVPLGVYAADDDAVELTLSGISQWGETLYLYDAVTKQSTPLNEDSYTIHLTGPSHGRYMLTAEASLPVEDDIRVYSPVARQIVVMSSPESPLRRIRVYDVAGLLEASGDDIDNSTFTLSVPSGIHVVTAESETGRVTVKVRVR